MTRTRTRTKPRLRIVIGAMAMVLASPVIADTVHLKNGRKITADSVRIEGDKLVLVTAVGTITIARADVESIDKGPTPKPVAAPLARPAAPLAAAGPSGTGPASGAAAAPSTGTAPGGPATPSTAAATPSTGGAPPAAGSSVEPSTSAPGERLVLESPPLQNAPRGLAERGEKDGPGSVNDWIAQGSAALKAHQYEKAESCFLAAVAADPRSTTAGLGVAAAKLGQGDAAGAAARAQIVVGSDPESAQGWFLLGEAEYGRGDLAAARRAFEKSRSLSHTAELDGWIARLEAEEKASNGYGSLWSGHFRLQFDPQSAPQRAREGLAYLDSIYEEMARVFSHHPSRGLTVVLYPRASFHELTGFGEEVLGLYDGKIRIPTGGSDQLRSDDRTTVRHELAHAFIDSKTAGHCPRWLHEGLAQRIEPRSASGLASSLAETKADEAALGGTYTYGSALSFVEFLEARYGEDRMNTLLDKLATEPRVDEAMGWAFGASYADLVAEWGRSLRARTGR